LGEPTSPKATPVSDPLVGFDEKLQALVAAVKRGIAKHDPQQPRYDYRTAEQAQDTEYMAAVDRGGLGMPAAAPAYNGQYDPAAEVRRGESAMRRVLDERAGEIQNSPRVTS